jgi:hypothetical protein
LQADVSLLPESLPSTREQYACASSQGIHQANVFYVGERFLLTENGAIQWPGMKSF